MDSFYSKISHLIFFFLFICFIPITVGVSRSHPHYKHGLYFTTDIHKSCFDSIHFIFDNNLQHGVVKTVYFQYALVYFRYATKEEKDDYIENFGPAEGSTDHPLLHEGIYGITYNNKYAYAYYQHIADKYIELSDDHHPRTFCKGFPGRESACSYTLKYFGFIGETMKEIIDYAYSKIVLFDIHNHEHVYQPGSPYPYPPTKYYALRYMEELFVKIATNQDELKWPEEFCVEKYPNNTNLNMLHVN